MAPKKPQSRPPPSSSSSEEEESDDEVQPSQTTKKPTTSTPVAPKLAPVKKPSSSSEEDDEEEDESGSDSEDLPTNSNKKAAPPPPPQQQQQQQGKGKEAPLSDSEESGSDESDSDDEPPKKAPPTRRPTRGPDPAIKPITSMPMDAKSPTSSKKSGGDKKRKAPDTMAAAQGDSPVPANGGTPAKKLFERVWNAEDEMVLLKAILRFKEKHGGRLPNMAAGVDELLEMVKNSLHVEFTRSQINTKIRTLKRRYEGILARPRTLSKSHEKSAFELSKKIWGDGPKLKAELGDDGGHSEDDAMEEDVTKSNVHKEKSVSFSPSAKKPNRSGAVSTAPVSALLEAPDGSAEDVSLGDGGGGAMYPVLAGAVEEVERFNTNTALRGLLRRAVGSLKPETANALEAKWKKQCMTELKMHGKRMEMLSELLKLLEDAILDGSN